MAKKCCVEESDESRGGKECPFVGHSCCCGGGDALAVDTKTAVAAMLEEYPTQVTRRIIVVVFAHSL